MDLTYGQQTKKKITLVNTVVLHTTDTKVNARLILAKREIWKLSWEWERTKKKKLEQKVR